jgi:hypothetical protein
VLRNFLFVIIFLIGGVSSELAAAAEPMDLDTIASLPQWRRLYQMRSNGKSAITSDLFFFSPNGSTDPLAEVTAAIHAYENPDLKFGREKKPAACAFPARKLVLEKMLQKNFAQPSCEDLKNWKERLNADQASLVFVGAFPGNPASIFGHTFLRLSNSKREAEGRQGIDLLSYAVGFLARSDPRDPQSLYMLKGLTGFYPGYYEMEPHYMKVGIYNNAESRDLWEVRLRLTPDEIELLTSYLWEVLFNAELKYYFIDENCSQKLIKLLEAVRPSLEISDKLSRVVLPAETVRAAIDAGLAEPIPKFRASIKRRLKLKLDELTGEEKQSFDQARRSLEKTKKVESSAVVSALLDHWLFVNYAASAKLPPDQAAMMDATYQRAAVIQTKPDPSNAAIREENRLRPPFLGHRPKWVDLHGGSVNEKLSAGIQYRSGVHPFWSSDRGYRDVSAIEFLGFNVDWMTGEDLRWKALLLDARSFENAFDLDPKVSWTLDLSANNRCWVCQSEDLDVQVNGGMGAAWVRGEFTIYSLAHVKSASWIADGVNALIAPGMLAGMKWGSDSSSFVIEGSHHWWRELRSATIDARGTYNFDVNRSLFLKFRYEDLGPRATRNEATLGWVQFFN